MNDQKPSGGCKYVPHVYPTSKRVSTRFFDTACGSKYVGMPINGRCKNCERTAVTAT